MAFLLMFRSTNFLKGQVHFELGACHLTQKTTGQADTWPLAQVATGVVKQQTVASLTYYKHS